MNPKVPPASIASIPKGLGAIRAWLDRFWDDALEAFKAEAEKPRSNDKENP